MCYSGCPNEDFPSGECKGIIGRCPGDEDEDSVREGRLSELQDRIGEELAEGWLTKSQASVKYEQLARRL